MAVEEWVGRSATQLAAAVREGQIEAHELIRVHLDRIAAVEPRLGAFVLVRGQGALADAKEVDGRADRAQLPLAGVPVAVSDVLDVSGTPTTHGSAVTPREPAAEDAEGVARLRAAGAIVIGKARCPELGLWGTADDDDGTAVSPWDPTRSAGGPAGGAAAAVAAGLAPLGLAPDGSGSVRVPAAACGVVGARPDADGVAEVISGVQQAFGTSRLGALATTVADARLLLDVLGGSTSEASAGGADPDRPLRVAVSWKAAPPGVAVSGSWREAALEAGRLLHHRGHEVAHEDPPYDRSSVQGPIARWTQGAGVVVESLGLDPEQLQPRTRGQVAAGARLGRVAPVQEEVATRWRERAGTFLDDFDVLVTPTLARTQPAAQAWHTRPWAANIAAELSTYPFTPPWTMADLPAIAVPLWQDAGRPLSVQLVAGPGAAARALAAAAELEALVPRPRQAPGWTADAQIQPPG